MSDTFIPLEWDTLRKQLCLFICNRTPNGDDAEDILQEVLLRIHANYNSVRDLKKLESWMYQIARHSIIDYYRSSRPEGELSEEILMADEEDLPDSAAQDLAPAILQIIHSLPDEYQEALIQVDMGGMSQVQLADQLKVPLSTIKSRVQRGRQMVRANLLACCHFEFDRRGKVLDYYQHCTCCC